MALTPREREVVLLVERDLSNEKIARKLGIRVGTVKTHVHKIVLKHGMTPSVAPMYYRRW
jgi:DNA-binding NarL/FixJ family response regulator